MSVTGYEVYRFYLGLKLHFTSDKYDVVKSKGKIRASHEAFNRRRDASLFETLATKFQQPREAVRYLVANFAYGHDNVIYDRDVGYDMLTHWTKVKESLSRVFESDLEIIASEAREKDLEISQVVGKDTQNNLVFNLYKQGKINVETICILIQLCPDMYDIWKNDAKTALIYANDLMRIKKLTSFVTVTSGCIKAYQEFCKDFNVASL